MLKKFDSNRTLFLRSNIYSVGNTIEEQPSLDTLEFAGGGNERVFFFFFLKKAMTVIWDVMKLLIPS
jgi:hypothetical protein